MKNLFRSILFLIIISSTAYSQAVIPTTNSTNIITNKSLSGTNNTFTNLPQNSVTALPDSLVVHRLMIANIFNQIIPSVKVGSNFIYKGSGASATQVLTSIDSLGTAVWLPFPKTDTSSLSKRVNVKWSTGGDSIPAGAYIGTSNNQNLVFKRNGLLAGVLDSASMNTYFGVGVGVPTSAYANAVFGFNAMKNNAASFYSTAIGANSLKSLVGNDYNTATGYNAGGGVQQSYGSTYMGYNAGSAITDHHYYSVFLGWNAGNTQLDGANNVFIGAGVQPNISTTGSNQLNIGNWIYGDSGKIGIGVIKPTAKLSVAGSLSFNTGNAAAGKVLTAIDSLGNTTWMPPASTYTDANAGNAFSYTNLGNNGAGSYNSATRTFNFPTYTITGLGSFDSTKIKSLVAGVQQPISLSTSGALPSLLNNTINVPLPLTRFVNTVSNLSALNVLDSVKQIVVSDSVIGGTFNIYTGTDPVDSAIVIQDATGRKWKRSITNGALDIRWFGALPNPFDSYNSIQKAINYHINHKATYVYIPNIGNYFFSSQTFNLTGNIIIRGDKSSIFNPTSQLQFPANKKGINFSVGYITMSDLYLFHSSYSVPDSTAHTVELHGTANFDNVTLANASGNDLHVDACAGDGTNADQSVFNNCGFRSALNNGVYLTGCDANIIVFRNCVSNDNFHWGFYTNGFLGNTFDQCQTANDGNQTDVIVNYNGHGYAARNFIGVNNINQKPDVANSQYWTLSEGYGTRNNWDSTKKYYSGGAYATTNDNAKDLFLNCYSEGYEPPSMFSSRGLSIGGLNGSGQTSGAAISVSQGVTGISGSLSVMGNVAGGTGVIKSNNYMSSPNYYTGSGGGLYFADGRDQNGTGIGGDSAGLKLLSGNQSRIFVERNSGNMLLSSNAYYPSTEKLTVDGNIQLNGRIKANGGFGNTGQVLLTNGLTGNNYWGNLDSSTIPSLATLNYVNNNLATKISSSVAAATYQPLGSYLTASSITGKVNYSDTTNILSAYQNAINVNTLNIATKLNLSGGTLTGNLLGLTPSISDSSAKFGTTAYIKQLFATIPKPDSALAGYGFVIDTVYANNKYNIRLRVDSSKIANDTKLGLTVTGTGGSYNSSTGVLNLTGTTVNTAVFVDTLSTQNVRGIKSYIGSSLSDAAPQTEQLGTYNWVSNGWTGSFAAGWTNTAGNTTALTLPVSANSGQLYQLYWNVAGQTTGSFTVSFGGITQSGITSSGNSGGVPATSTATYSITPTSDFNGTIIPSVKAIGYSSPNAVWASSDLTNLFQIRIPVNAYSAGLGINTLRRLTTGTNNLAFGASSQQNTTSGAGNMSFGTNTLAANTTGGNNIVFGLNAGQNNTTGGTNNYLGYYAGSANTTGSNNIAIGGLSLFNSATGSNNTGVGNNAGRYAVSSTNLVNCTNCSFFGADTKAGADGLTNITAIGSGAVSPAVSNSVQVGSAANTLVSLTGRVITGSLTDNGTDQLQVTGSAKITGQLNIPNGTLNTSAVNLGQMNTAISAVSGGASTASLVDTLNNQNVRGIKTFVGSTASDMAPQSEQLVNANFGTTGWTGTMATGFTNGASNTNPLTNTLAATSGQLYQLYWNVTNRTTGSFTVSFGGISSTGNTATGNSGGVPATSTATYVITPTSDFNGTIIPSVKTIGYSAANMVWTSSDQSNLFQVRVPINAYSFGLGLNSLRRLSTGTNNLAFGSSSQQNTTSGSGNSSFGTNALAANNTGANNTAFGGNAGVNNTSGYNNNFFGSYAGNANTTGYNNFAGGGLSLFNITTGNGNTGVGNNAGRYAVNTSTNLVNCTNCTFLGSETKAGADGLFNVTALGTGAITLPVSNSTQIGGVSNTVTNITGRTLLGGATDNSTDQLQVTGSASFSGQVNVPTATLTTAAVNLAQLNAAATAASFSPTYTNTTNASSSANGSSIYIKTGTIVHARITGTVTPTATGLTELTITLPLTTTNASQAGVGQVSVKENGGADYIVGEVLVLSATTLKVRFLATIASTAQFTATVDYQL